MGQLFLTSLDWGTLASAIAEISPTGESPSPLARVLKTHACYARVLRVLPLYWQRATEGKKRANMGADEQMAKSNKERLLPEARGV